MAYNTNEERLKVRGSEQITRDLKVNRDAFITRLEAGKIEDKGDLNVDGEIIAGDDVTISGDLYVNGTEYINDSETAQTTDNYLVLRHNQTTPLGTNEHSGVAVHNYAVGKTATITADKDGTWRVADNTETDTNYTDISYYNGTFYTGLTRTAATVISGMKTAFDEDELDESVYYNTSYYHFDGNNWFPVSLVDNKLTLGSAVTDSATITALNALTKEDLVYFRTLTVTTINEVENQPLLTRAEASNLTGGQALTWDATNQKAVGKTIDTTVTSGSSNLITSGAVADCVTDVINTLDVASVGGSGKYISAISETDGKISATTGTIDTAVTANSSNLITSGAVKSAIDTAEANAKCLDNATGVLGISHGGTGATSAANARTCLGLGNLATVSTNNCTSEFLRGDGTWANIPSSGTVTISNASTGDHPVALCTGATSVGKSTGCSLVYNTATGQLSAASFNGKIHLPEIQGLVNLTGVESTIYPGQAGDIYNLRESPSNNNCGVTFNTATGVLTAKTFCGNVSSNSLTLTGDLCFKGTCATQVAIQHKDSSDSSGEGILIGAGGLTVIGSGESAGTFWANAGCTAGNEQTIVASDNDVIFVTNLQNGWAGRKTTCICSTNGYFYGNVCGNVCGTAAYPGWIVCCPICASRCSVDCQYDPYCAGHVIVDCLNKTFNIYLCWPNGNYNYYNYAQYNAFWTLNNLTGKTDYGGMSGCFDNSTAEPRRLYTVNIGCTGYTPRLDMILSDHSSVGSSSVDMVVYCCNLYCCRPNPGQEWRFGGYI